MRCAVAGCPPRAPRVRGATRATMRDCVRSLCAARVSGCACVRGRMCVFSPCRLLTLQAAAAATRIRRLWFRVK